GVNTAIRLWKTATGEELLPSTGHLDGILAMAFLSDNQTLISAGMRGTVCRWDATTGRTLGARTQLQREDALAGAISPDGRLLALGDTQGGIQVSDVDTGADLCHWQGHKDWIFRLAFAADGKRLASGGHDKTRALWEPLTGREIARFTKDQDDIGSVAFSPDASLLAHGCEDGAIVLLDSAGKVRQRFGSGPYSVRGLAFSPDGKTLASASTAQASESGPGTVSLWEVNTGQARWQARVSDGRIHCLTFSPDGWTLALGSGDHQVHRWDLSTGQERAPLTGHLGAVRCLAYSPDGSLL